MCLFDLEVGAVYVAVWSVVKDDPLKLRSYFTQGRLLAKSGGPGIEMTSRLSATTLHALHLSLTSFL
jgi:hypothetical protein